METSKASAVPLKEGANAQLAGGGQPPYDGDMEHRVTALETRLDIILPTLATKADIAEMRAEMRADLHKMNAEIKTWTLATMLTIVGTMLAALLGISQIFKASSTPPVAMVQPAPIIITLPSIALPLSPGRPN
ncbi:MAG: hypothetical protein QFF03_03675 [Pseudomonadota bacterium]|nr:hypothetical protein [Pseudomonadota bacterium]